VGVCEGGVLLAEFDRPSLRAAVDAVQSIDRAGLRERVSRFSSERFQTEVREWVTTSTGQAMS
jgi:hypothetical protein